MRILKELAIRRKSGHWGPREVDIFSRLKPEHRQWIERNYCAAGALLGQPHPAITYPHDPTTHNAHHHYHPSIFPDKNGGMMRSQMSTMDSESYYLQQNIQDQQYRSAPAVHDGSTMDAVQMHNFQQVQRNYLQELKRRSSSASESPRLLENGGGGRTERFTAPVERIDRKRRLHGESIAPLARPQQRHEHATSRKAKRIPEPAGTVPPAQEVGSTGKRRRRSTPAAAAAGAPPEVEINSEEFMRVLVRLLPCAFGDRQREQNDFTFACIPWCILSLLCCRLMRVCSGCSGDRCRTIATSSS
jgi:hypothetical protein